MIYYGLGFTGPSPCRLELVVLTSSCLQEKSRYFWLLQINIGAAMSYSWSTKNSSCLIRKKVSITHLFFRQQFNGYMLSWRTWLSIRYCRYVFSGEQCTNRVSSCQLFIKWSTRWCYYMFIPALQLTWTYVPAHSAANPSEITTIYLIEQNL